MIPRTARPRLERLARQFPAVTVTGPRQSGKTTLCRQTFPGKAYVSLEAPDVRDEAARDPRGFLARYRDGAIFDEVQRLPELLSYLQGEIDERPRPGRFILTGSANFALLRTIGQSLAGRAALLTLLPLSLEEVSRARKVPEDPFEVVRTGGYPAIWAGRLDPWDWASSYLATYVERDVRQLTNVGDLTSFQTFVRLCAGRCGQLLNLSSLGADAGVAANTAKAWLSILEASYVLLRLAPFHANVTSRLVKAPKLHFVDSGLACFLLGIRNVGQLREHPLRGALFESWVVSEVTKARLHRGTPLALSFFRSRKGAEVDLVLERALDVVAVEVKSGGTVASDFFAPLAAFARLLEASRPRRRVRSVLVYGGAEARAAGDVQVLPWRELQGFDWAS